MSDRQRPAFHNPTWAGGFDWFVVTWTDYIGYKQLAFRIGCDLTGFFWFGVSWSKRR